jgi:catechol 2,3-dioxygenase-like lactoylglutathione lyase family enzyme
LFDEHGYPPDRDHFAVRVDDLEAHCALLRSNGFDVEVREFPWGRSAYLLDPDGRVVEIQASDASYG